MKILIVCPFFHPHLGGVESHVRDLGLKLIERGHEVHVLTNAIPEGPLEFEYHGIKVHRVKPMAQIATVPISPSIYRQVQQFKVDVVHAHFPPPLTPYYGLKGAKKKGLPTVLTYHCDPILDNPLLKPVEELYFKTYGKRMVSYADAIIATSHSYKRTSRLLWNLDNVYVIPNAVNLEFFDGKDRSEEFREKYNIWEDFVLFVGRLVPHKNVEVFVESAEYSDVLHVVVGGGPLFERLSRMVTRLGLQRRVRILGPIPNEDLRAAYSATKLVVLPSISRLEAFGIVLLEALAMGTPVLVADIPGVRTIADAIGGPKFDPLDPRNLGDKIKEILGNWEKYREIARKGQKVVKERYNWDRVVEDVLKVYDSLYSF